ncbi:MAG: RecQ family ATP-dependent DNA helicase [Spirochaetales bacterium]|nr:RecQ family ATP-dependent DNA helicase [Spirochaetales bacterium]
MLNKAQQYLKQFFGYDSFRPGQEKIISSILDRKDTLGIMPTGGGKSICYEIPALCFSGLTVVISPLISLMKDQIDQLSAIRYPAAMLNSTVDYPNQVVIKQAIEDRRIKLLYLTPERFANPRFTEWLKRQSVSLFCVDEAHCISEWGHDFRVEYRRLANVISELDNPPVLALTATATAEVKDDIIKSLRMTKPNVFISGFNRDNLTYHIMEADNSEDKDDMLIRYLETATVPGIIYVSSVKAGNNLYYKLAQALPQKKIGLYHGSLQPHQRKGVQEAFLNDQVEILIATNAFGMGVNKTNIRFVVHYNIPGTIESYYQETGRAGRDGLMSECLLLYMKGDERIQEYFIESKNPTISDMRTLLAELVKLNKLGNIYKDDIPKMIDDRKINSFKLDSAYKQLLMLHFIEENAVFNPSVTITILKDNKDESLVSFFEELRSMAEYNEVSVNMGYLCRRCDSTEKQILNMLDRLQKNKTIRYVYVRPGQIVSILKDTISDQDADAYIKHTREKTAKDTAKFRAVVRYATDHTQCRRKYLLGYFGEQYTETNCGKCDVCLGSRRQTAPLEITDLHKSILRFFWMNEKKIGRRNAVRIMCGAYDCDPKYRSWDEFAMLKGTSPERVESIISQLLKHQLLASTAGQYPVIYVTDRGLNEIKKKKW